MKKLKFLVLLLILAFLGLFIYQNIDYFMTKETVEINLNFFQWLSPPLPVILYWGICFVLGFLITGIRGLSKSFGLKREIKKKDANIKELETKVKDLQTRVDDLTRTPLQQPEVSTDPGLPTEQQDKTAGGSDAPVPETSENIENPAKDAASSSDGETKKD